MLGFELGDRSLECCDLPAQRAAARGDRALARRAGRRAAGLARVVGRDVQRGGDVARIDPVANASWAAFAAIELSAATRPGSAATKVPLPWWVSTSPFCSRRPYTLRTVLTFNPVASASSRSVGSCCPAS